MSTHLLTLFSLQRYSIFTAPLPDSKVLISSLESLSKVSIPPSMQKSQDATPLKVLHNDSSSITVGWDFSDETSGQYISTHFPNYINTVSIRRSGHGSIGPWMEVYRGCGKGCHISNLDGDSTYHIRLVHDSQRDSSQVSTSYIMAQTSREDET